MTTMTSAQRTDTLMDSAADPVDRLRELAGILPIHERITAQAHSAPLLESLEQLRGLDLEPQSTLFGIILTGHVEEFLASLPDPF